MFFLVSGSKWQWESVTTRRSAPSLTASSTAFQRPSSPNMAAIQRPGVHSFLEVRVESGGKAEEILEQFLDAFALPDVAHCSNKSEPIHQIWVMISSFHLNQFRILKSPFFWHPGRHCKAKYELCSTAHFGTYR